MFRKSILAEFCLSFVTLKTANFFLKCFVLKGIPDMFVFVFLSYSFKLSLSSKQLGSSFKFECISTSYCDSKIHAMCSGEVGLEINC